MKEENGCLRRIEERTVGDGGLYGEDEKAMNSTELLIIIQIENIRNEKRNVRFNVHPVNGMQLQRS